LKAVALCAGQKVLIQVDDRISVIVGDPQGILDQASPIPIIA